MICDHEGRVVAALSTKLWCPFVPLEAEAMAFMEAIDFTWDVGIRDAHFESDSLVVCDALRGLSTPLVGISNIVSNMCLRLQYFRFVQVSHVKRLGNKPDHILTQYARDLDSYVTWVEKNLVFLESTLTHDILNLSSSE